MNPTQTQTPGQPTTFTHRFLKPMTISNYDICLLTKMIVIIFLAMWNTVVLL